LSSVGCKLIAWFLENERVKGMKGKLIYTGIRVRDLGISLNFYTKLLGMTETGRSTISESGGENVQLVSEKDGPVLELNHYEKGSKFDTKYVPGEALDHVAFQVGDLDAFLEDAKKAGYPVRQEMRVGNNRWAYIEDPNGIWIEVFA
jgi:lactoylglutathione lyase